MAIQVIEVKLKEGTDEAAFISEFDSVSEVTVKNTIPDIPTLLVMKIEESYLSTFRSHTSVEWADKLPQAFPSVTYPSVPSKYTQSAKKVDYGPYSASENGTDYIPYQFYLDSDLFQKSGNNKLGIANDYNSFDNSYTARTKYDEIDDLAGQIYSSNYTGKYVDIITIEAPDTFDANSGKQDSHPDFDDPDNTGNTRCVPKNWYQCEGTQNNQVTSNSMFSSHAMGVLSVCGGVNCGYAKKSKLYATYLESSVSTTGDTLTEICQAIIYFHNNKGTNGTTGLKDPTVVIGEFQYLQDTYQGIKITDITAVTDPTGGTTNRPGGGWGSDLTPFTSRNIFPYRVQDPDDDSWHWMVTFPAQYQYSSVKTAIDSLYDNGITFITAAGNNGGTYVKENDPRWNGTYCTVASGSDNYNIRYTSNNQGNVSSPSSTSTTTWYPFMATGPHGLAKGIDVAAGQNSETHPMLDAYTNRGPGIDIIGRGAATHSASPGSTTYADGNKWDTFSGTSCAAPTVVGKAACMMEEYYTLNGAWPTPTQVKNMLVTEARNGNNRALDPASTTWSNVPTAASTTIQSVNQKYYPIDSSLVRIAKNQSMNGSNQFAELAGTPPFYAFWNAKGHSREQTMHRRPTTGVMYPRPRNISNIE